MIELVVSSFLCDSEMSWLLFSIGYVSSYFLNYPVQLAICIDKKVMVDKDLHKSSGGCEVVFIMVPLLLS